MDNLNKENFFDAIANEYPNAFAKFSKFIDEYKVSVDWSDLFNGDALFNEFGTTEGMKNANDYTPKFHDLPYEMQVGIVMKFMAETAPQEATDLLTYFYTKEVVTTFRETFEYLEKRKASVEELQEQDLKNIREKGQSNNQ